MPRTRYHPDVPAAADQHHTGCDNLQDYMPRAHLAPKPFSRLKIFNLIAGFVQRSEPLMALADIMAVIWRLDDLAS